jgi:outer membrane immunogenic protein
LNKRIVIPNNLGFMKKINFLLVLTLFICTLSVYAQAPLAKGEKQLNAGLGLSGWGLPVYAGLDFGVDKDITIGIEGSFRAYSDSWNHNSYSHTIIGITGNGNYHFNSLLLIPSEWDLYAGLNLGFYAWSSPSGYDGPHNSGLGIGLQIGGRYFFSKKFGLNLELSGGNDIMGGKFGISYKF